MRPEIIEGDVQEVLKTLDDESVQCVVTSPPYWGLRDYGTATWEGGDEDCEHTVSMDPKYSDPKKKKGSLRPEVSHRGGDASKCRLCGAKRIDDQLGLEATPEEYVENMVSVFQEVKRVLRKDGTVWLNLGDTYYGGGAGQKDTGKAVYNMEHFRQRPLTDKHPTLKPKDLVGIPWRVAFALQADGWYLRSDIIWNKPNAMPEPVKDRPTKSHEYIFLLTKSKKYYYDNEAIKERGGHSAGAGTTKTSKIDKYGDAETEAMYRQGMHRHRGKNLIATRPDLPSQKEFVDFIRAKTNAKELSEKSGIELSTVEHWFRYDESGFSFPNVEDWTIIRGFVKDEDMDKRLTNIEFHYDSIKSKGANKRSVWKITTKPYKGAHFATFPEELPETCIKAGTKRGDVVLDIFAGSGTTLRVASKLGRKGIGIELNPEYIKILKKRCRIESVSLEAFA